MTGNQVRQIQDALLSAFTSREQLAQMMRVRLEQNLEAIAEGDTLTKITFALVRWAEANGCLGALVAGALAEVPGNPELQAVAAAMLNQVDARRSRNATVADTMSLADMLDQMGRALRDEIRGTERRLSDRMDGIEKKFDAQISAVAVDMRATYHPLLKPPHTTQWLMGFMLFVACLVLLAPDFRAALGVSVTAATVIALPMFALSGYLFISGLGFSWEKRDR